MYILVGPKRKHSVPSPFFSLLLTKHPLKLLSIYFSLNFPFVVLYVSIFRSLYHLYHLVSEFGLLGFLIVSYPFIPTKILIATLVYSKQGWLDPTHNINFRNAFLNFSKCLNSQYTYTYICIYIKINVILSYHYFFVLHQQSRLNNRCNWCNCLRLPNKRRPLLGKYIYIYVCVCVCVIFIYIF